MKSCTYCGQSNDDNALRCQGCGSEFTAADDAALSDPTAALMTLASFGDLIHATLVKDRLVAAGINACIPEELAANPFGHFEPMAHITVQVASRDLEAAKEILANAGPPPLPGDVPDEPSGPREGQ